MSDDSHSKRARPGAHPSHVHAQANATPPELTAAYLRRRSSQMVETTPASAPPLPSQGALDAKLQAQPEMPAGSAGPSSATGHAGVYGAAATSAASSSSSSIANRRPSARAALQQADFPLSLSSLTPPSPPTLPFIPRSATATPAASSPLTTPFAKQRAADEIKAVADMLADRGAAVDGDGVAQAGGGSSSTHNSRIQRPASAPPRGRSFHSIITSTLPSDADDDAGVDAIEKASGFNSRRSSVTSIKQTQAAATTSLSEIAGEAIEKFAAHLSDRALAVLFLFIVAWGAVLSLDRLTTYSYQTIATNSFAHHSSLAEVNVVRAVVAAVAAIPFATIADLGGRAQAFTIGLALYAAGHATMAGSTSVPSYIAGVVLYELGANGLVCLQNIVLANMTSSRNRLFFQILPQMPFLVFSFISSDIYSAILPRWRWGMGMFAILGPATLLPVISILGDQQHQQRQQQQRQQQQQQKLSQPPRKEARTISTLLASRPARRASLQQTDSTVSYVILMIKHIWQTSDLLGLLVLAAGLTLTLIPLTLAASAPNQWEDGKILGMISSGVALLAFFAYWEFRQASHPVIPKALLNNRTFWASALSLCCLTTAHSVMLAYFPTYLYVVHGVSNRAQQNFSVIYSFTVAAASLPTALLVRYTRRMKIFVMLGIVVFTAGLGSMIGARGTEDSDWVIASSQVLIGLGGALTVAVIQASVQVAVTPAVVAQSIAALNIFPCMGNAIGAAVAGAMWSGLLPGKLARNLSPTGHLNDLATIYAEPLTWIEQNPLGSATRTAVVSAYNSCWRAMMIAATLTCATSFVLVFWTQNLRLGDDLSAESVFDDQAVKEAAEPRASASSAAYGGSTLHPRLFGDRLFERFEDALGRTLIRRVPKKAGSTPDSPTDTRVCDRAGGDDSLTVNNLLRTDVSMGAMDAKGKSSKWSSWGPFQRRANRRTASKEIIPTTLGGLIEDDKSAAAAEAAPLPSPIESVGPAPILIVDEEPFAPILSPPTPPASRMGHSATMRALSPLPPSASRLTP